MATTIANLSVLLTARTSDFSGKMARAATDLQPLNKAVGQLNKLARITFGFVALEGILGQLRRAGDVARELGITLSTVDQAGLDNLVADFNLFRGAIAKSAMLIGAELAPQLGIMLTGLSRIALTMANVITPELVHAVVVTGRWALTIFVAVKAYKAMIVVIAALAKAGGVWGAVQAAAFFVAINGARTYIVLQDIMAAKTTVLIGLQTILNFLMGPAGWAKLVVAIVAGAAAFVGLSWVFSKFTGDADKALGGLNAELAAMERQIRSIKGLTTGGSRFAHGVIGRDFLAAMPRRGNAYALQEFLAGGEIGKKIDRTNQLLSESMSRRALK